MKRLCCMPVYGGKKDNKIEQTANYGESLNVIGIFYYCLYNFICWICFFLIGKFQCNLKPFKKFLITCIRKLAFDCT